MLHLWEVDRLLAQTTREKGFVASRFIRSPHASHTSAEALDIRGRHLVASKSRGACQRWAVMLTIREYLSWVSITRSGRQLLHRDLLPSSPSLPIRPE